MIACPTKHIAKFNWVKVQKMERKDAESGLDFIGFIIFENKLKSDNHLAFLTSSLQLE